MRFIASDLDALHSVCNAHGASSTVTRNPSQSRIEARPTSTLARFSGMCVFPRSNATNSALHLCSDGADCNRAHRHFSTHTRLATALAVLHLSHYCYARSCVTRAQPGAHWRALASSGATHSRSARTRMIRIQDGSPRRCARIAIHCRRSGTSGRATPYRRQDSSNARNFARAAARRSRS